MKIAILGTSGSGKSTLAKRLGERYGLPVLHMDTVHFLPGWVERPFAEEEAIVRQFLDENAGGWVIDGNYSKTCYARRLEEADKIIVLWFSPLVCLWRAVRRWQQNKGRVRESSAPGCEEKIDAEFVRWILHDGRTKQKWAKMERIDQGRQDHRGRAQAQGTGGRGQAVILYEDTALVVLDKPAGLSSEDGVPAALRKLWGRPDAYVGVIHRLDTGVSGLMVYAKTPQAAAALSRQVTQSQQVYAEQDGRAEPDAGTPDAPPFVKQYRALIAGGPDEKLPAEGVLRDYLFKDSRKGRVFPVSRPRKGVKEAVLEYRISASAPDGSASLADITLHTGRTHQIRVQFASRRHPLWGDGKYGSRIKGDIALQSARLRFIHPDTGKGMDFRLPVLGTWPAWGIRQENDNGTTV